MTSQQASNLRHYLMGASTRYVGAQMCSEDFEDLVSKTVVRYLTAGNPRKYPPCELGFHKGYASKILHNNFIDYLRAKKNQKENLPLTHVDAVKEDTNEFLLFSRSLDPESLANWHLLNHILSEEMNEPVHNAFKLYYLEDMSLKETADALGIEIHQVKSRVHRSKMLLYDLWKEHLNPIFGPYGRDLNKGVLL